MKLPMRFCLIFGFTGLIVVFAAMIIVSSFVTSGTVLSEHARTIMENIASYTIDKSESHLIPARNAARLTQGLSQSDIVSNRDVQAMVTYFYEQLYIYPQFSGIYFAGADGEFIMASRYNKLEEGGFFTKIISHHGDERVVEKLYRSASGWVIKDEIDKTDTYDPRTRPWFKRAKEQGRLIWTDPYIFFTSRQPGITTANPVYDEKGTFVGVIGVDIEIEELSTFISRLRVGNHGRAFIIGRKGDLIAYPDIEKIRHTTHDGGIRLAQILELDDPVSRKAFLSLGLPKGKFIPSSPVFTAFESGGERYNAMFAPFKDAQWNWTIGIYMPEDDYLGAIKKNRTFNILVAMVMVGIAGLIGLLVARKLNEAREAAESADKAKSSFLARMSHEIRTPMNAILGAGELLAETDLSQEQLKYVRILQGGGDHLRDLVSDVLDLSRIESDQFSLADVPFNLSELIENTCDLFSLDAGKKNLNLSCELQEGTPDSFQGDPAALKQILINLIGNAIKFTEEGSVRLVVRQIHSDETRPDMATLEVEVTDTGIGIAPEMQPLIFKRFVQEDGSLSRQYGGTGLGLAICRRLAQAMNGDVSMTSIPGQGSTFRVSVKLNPQSSEVRTNLPNQGVARTIVGRTRRILMVEDDERNRMLFELFLKDIPHELRMVQSGAEALEAHKDKPFDLIFMDIEMADMDGYEVTGRIRKWEREHGKEPVPIVAISAHAAQGQWQRCSEAGCSAFLPKPVSKVTLLDAVSKWLDGDRPS